jgi:hypothetical protein
MPITFGRISGTSQRPGSRRAESGQWFCTILIALALGSLTRLPATAQSRGNMPMAGPPFVGIDLQHRLPTMSGGRHYA